jgi:hypothetical protein
MRRLHTLAIVLAASLTASLAGAEVRDPARAEILFRDGRARMEAGDAAQACPKFAESLRLEFALGTLLNLAACEEQLGQLASAWEHFVLLSSQLPASDDRRAFVVERAAKLEPRVPRLTVTIVHAPAGAVVTRDDVVIATATFGESLAVNPGAHRVVVVAPGHVDSLYDVTLREGERRSLMVTPGEVTAPEAARRRGADTKRTVGWVLGGVGTLSLATGVYFGARALSERSRSDELCGATTCRDAAGVQAYDDAKTFSRVADVTLGVGIVAVGVAAYLVLSSPGASEQPTSPPRTAIRVTPFGIGGVW